MTRRALVEVDAALEAALARRALASGCGGFATLGAVVAPLVFGIVPAPASADAMTAVFRRFDSVAIVCAVVVLVAEGGHAVLRAPRRSCAVDVARTSLVGRVAAAL